jgi:hypothetical protein
VCAGPDWSGQSTSKWIVSIPGTTKRHHLDESCGSSKSASGIALGASRRQVFRTVAGGTTMLVMAGLIGGGGLTAAVMRLSCRVLVSGALPELRTLMAASIRELTRAYLDAARVEASFEIRGVDTLLIDDGTYFVVECERRSARQLRRD